MGSAVSPSYTSNVGTFLSLFFFFSFLPLQKVTCVRSLEVIFPHLLKSFHCPPSLGLPTSTRSHCCTGKQCVPSCRIAACYEGPHKYCDCFRELQRERRSRQEDWYLKRFSSSSKPGPLSWILCGVSLKLKKKKKQKRKKKQPQQKQQLHFNF